MKKAPKINNDKMTSKQRIFCREYIYDWNGTRAYRVAYPSVKSDPVAAANSSRLLRNAKVIEYIEEIQKDLEKIAGLSRLKVIEEHKKIAFNSIAHLHNTWIERKAFELLTEDQKSCIAEISTQTKTLMIPGTDSCVEVDFVKIKLYDKQKALDSITKMLGYEAPERRELTGKDGKDLIPAKVLQGEEIKEFIQALKNDY